MGNGYVHRKPSVLPEPATFTFTAGVVVGGDGVTTYTGYKEGGIGPGGNVLGGGSSADNELDGTYYRNFVVFEDSLSKRLILTLHREDETYPAQDFVAITFTDKNDVEQTFLVAASEFYEGISDFGVEGIFYFHEYSWALADSTSTDLFEVGESYTVTFN